MLKLIMEIGKVKCNNNLILAPLASVTDLGLKYLAIKFGADFAVSEMVSVKGLKYKNKATLDLLKTAENEKIKVVQLFGSDPEIFKEVVGYKELEKFDIIDINMGCPAPKVIKNGDGCKLMTNFELSRSIIKACVDNTDKPITVKFRAGYDNVCAVEFAKMCEEAGASAITIHPRLKSQYYSGSADYSLIKQVKEAVNIPVIGSGDVVDKKSYMLMLDTKVDAVMIGRGALGSPEIFATLLDRPIDMTKLDMIKLHYKILLDNFDENFVVKHMRKHLLWYLKGVRNASTIKQEIVKLNSISEILKLLEEKEEILWKK